MVNNFENCRYTNITPEGKKFRYDTFIRTEIWHQFGDPELHATNLSVNDAIRYVVRNSSVKIFPDVWKRHRDDVVSLLTAQDRYKFSILVLRRDRQAVIESYQNLGNTFWNGVYPFNYFRVAENSAYGDKSMTETLSLGQRSLSHRVYRQIEDMVGRYAAFETDVIKFLESEEGLLHDVVNYDGIKHEPAILLNRNRCVIRNCNFNNSEYENAVRNLRIPASLKSRFFTASMYRY